jgi:hypothetical protein
VTTTALILAHFAAIATATGGVLTTREGKF